MICSLKYRRRSEPNKDHRRQQSPYENDWFPGDENEKSHTALRATSGEYLRVIIGRKLQVNSSSGLLFLLGSSSCIRKRTLQIGR